MKKIFLFLFCVSFIATSTNAQVVIGAIDEPIDGAILELRSSNMGFMPPRVPLVSITSFAPIGDEHVKGMVVFNTTTNVAETLDEGLYLNDGEKWLRLSTTHFRKEEWLYMPSIVFRVDLDEDEVVEVDLWYEYARQKHYPVSYDNGNVVKSPSAPNQVMAIVPDRNQFYYYVTDYDTSVFQIESLTDDGKLSYKVIGQATEETLINIVFVEK